ncbi:hypothetical protein GCK32_001496 [Trichostrongylus colubriformis]|uniref:Secreted protein n=1 Tax=Trichostrongylus colubriformis TaxID=6319 RepID=A0AAN8IG78_TRICO
MDTFYDRLHLILLIAIFVVSCSGHRENGHGMYRRQATSNVLYKVEVLRPHQPPLIDYSPGPLRYLLPNPQPAAIFFASNSWSGTHGQTR